MGLWRVFANVRCIRLVCRSPSMGRNVSFTRIACIPGASCFDHTAVRLLCFVSARTTTRPSPNSASDLEVPRLKNEIISEIESLISDINLRDRNQRRDNNVYQLIDQLSDKLSDPMCDNFLLIHALRNLPPDLQDVVWGAVLHQNRWSAADCRYTCSMMLVFRQLQAANIDALKGANKATERSSFPHFNKLVLLLSDHIAVADIPAKSVFFMLEVALKVGVPNASALLDVAARLYSDFTDTVADTRLVSLMCSTLSLWRLKYPAAKVLLNRVAVVVKDRADEFEPKDLVRAMRALVYARQEVSDLLEAVDMKMSKCMDDFSNNQLQDVCVAFRYINYQTKYACIGDECLRRMASLPELVGCLRYLAAIKPVELGGLLQKMQENFDASQWSMLELSQLVQSLFKGEVLALFPTSTLAVVEKTAVFLDVRVEDIPPQSAGLFLLSFASCGMVTEPLVGLLDRIAVHSCLSLSSISASDTAWLLAGLYAAFCASNGTVSPCHSRNRIQFTRKEFCYKETAESSVVGGLTLFVKNTSKPGWYVDIEAVKLEREVTFDLVLQMCKQVRSLRLSGAKGLLASLASYGLTDISKSHQLTSDSCTIAHSLSYLRFDAPEFFSLFCHYLEKLRFPPPARFPIEALCRVNVACVLQGYFPKQAIARLFSVWMSFSEEQKVAIRQCSSSVLWLSTHSQLCNGPQLSVQSLRLLRKSLPVQPFITSNAERAVFNDVFPNMLLLLHVPLPSMVKVTAVLCFDTYGRPLPKDSRLPANPKHLLSCTADYLLRFGVRLLVFLLVHEKSLDFKLHQHLVSQDVVLKETSMRKPVGATLITVHELKRHGFPTVILSRDDLIELPSQEEQRKFLTACIPHCYQVPRAGAIPH